MKQTWRWFGPDDPISIAEIRQTGATGVVTALHHVPPGQIWSVADIKLRQSQIENPNGIASGLAWDVVESLPVSEAIKTQSDPFKDHVAAYKQSLRNLAACGIHTICYNFMPILDWTRTDLSYPLPNGGHAMRFDLVDFAAFDCFILKRIKAEEDYTAALIEVASQRFADLSDVAREKLSHNIISGLPGANDSWLLEDVRGRLSTYTHIDAEALRSNLIDFLTEIIPTAEANGIRLCCHPDDPPFQFLGLPRVMSTQADCATLLNAVDSPANGITFCTGSLGVAEDFDPAAFVADLGHRIHFAHLRNTLRSGAHEGFRHSFTEAEHLVGDTDMVATVRALLNEEAQRRQRGRSDHELPMRPDHGHALLSDHEGQMQPGYPLIGRMRGLAELRGLIFALK